MSEHETNHIVDQIEAYLAEGLSPDERRAFEEHAASCAACGRALADARCADAELRELFAAARPAAALEDHVIRSLRTARTPHRRIIHPMALRSAAAVAAAVLLTGTGVVVSNVLEAQNARAARLDDVEDNRAVQSNLNQIGKAMIFARNFYSAPGQNGPTTQPFALGEVRQSGAQRGWAFTSQPVDGKVVEQLEGQVKQLSDQGRWGEARDANRKLLETDPGNRLAYELKPQIEQKENFGLAYYYARPSGQGQSGESHKRELKDGVAVHSGAVANGPVTIADDTSAFRPSDSLSKLSIATKEPAQQVDRILATGAAGDRGEGKSSDMPALATGLGDKAGKADQSAPAPAEPAAPPVAAPQTPKPASPPPAEQQQAPVTGRKIIRNGTMEFEVQNFDDALLRVTKLVAEQGGFVATTDSDKLPNGKVKGTITLRVPAEHLDTLVLTLRGIGDLKTQKISAEDVTKHYTDLESELRAARAMEERLLDIIKTGKGQIKDLLEAEKQLGVWREKIEQIEGERRYLSDLVALSTLSVVLYERDIKTPASATETEQVTMSLETEKVDEAYAKARSVVESAKGRITQAELKQFDAGQFGATIQAAIPPDAAEETIARLRQLSGRIAHFSRDSRRTTQNGQAPLADVKVQREDVVLSMQIYNLANIAPRRTTTVKIAATNVDAAYHKLVDQVQSIGGRIVTSSLSRPEAAQQSAELDVQVASDRADALQDALRSFGEVMRQDSAENPDTANVTEAKRGFHVTLVSLAAVPARESQDVRLAASDVSGAFYDLLNAIAQAGGRVLQSNLNEQDRQNVTGTISLEIARPAAKPIESEMGKAAQVLTRTINRSPDTENTVDTKLHLTLTLSSAEQLPPRQTVTVSEEVSDVQRSVDDLVNAAATAGGRRLGSGELNQDRAGHVTARVVVDVPLDKADAIIDQLDRMGYRRGKQVSFDNSVPEGRFARARIDATFSNSSASLGGEESTWDALRHGLATSGRGLRWSLQYLIVGLCFVLPWVLLVWLIWRLFRRRRSTPPTSPAAA